MALPQLLEHGETVLLGQHDVEQHHVGLLLEGQLQAFLAALRGQDLVALVSEIVGQPVEQPFCPGEVHPAGEIAVVRGQGVIGTVVEADPAGRSILFRQVARVAECLDKRAPQPR